ncbi:MAG: efflux RND transporter periplasmic adaptor subunit [Abitibacteriaceae bacterium]|nr:efflux RND transporter periplasmic adaptor subunit [Abditibacteriaceae bacterium]
MKVSNYQQSTEEQTTVPRETVPRVERPGPAPAPPPGKTPRWLPIAIIAALLIGGLFLRSRNKGASTAPVAGNTAAQAPQITTVKVMPVAVGNLAQSLDITGSLKTNQNINLSSKIVGRIAQLYVQEGSRVRMGELVVQLDDADLRAQVAAAQAALRTAQVRYNQTVVGLPARVQQVGTTIEQARTALQTAQARYRQALLNENPRIVAAQQQVNTARDTVKTAQARLKQARETATQTQVQVEEEIKRTATGVEAAQSGVTSAQSQVASSQAALADIRRGAREQQIAQAQAAVNLAQANLKDAETELNRQKILVAGGAAAQSAVDAAQTRYDVNQAQLQSAQQNLSLVREGNTNEQIRQAEEAVNRAQQGVIQAQTNVQQAENLRAQAVAGRAREQNAQADVSAALAALATAQSGLQTAQSNLAQIPITRQETVAAKQAVDQARAGLVQAQANRSQIPIAQSDIQAAAAAVQSARAGVQQAQVNLSYARIYSPVNGVVNTKLADVGSAVSPGSTMLNIVSLDRVYFEALVSENNVNRIRTGQQASLIVPSVSAQALRGFVSDIIPNADPRSRQFRVRITVPNAPSQLTPGAFARGTLVTQTVYNALVVPSDAIQEINGQSAVLIASGTGNEARVQRRNVRVGIAANGRTQVMGNIVKGERVIMGNEPLEDGEKVKVASAA